MNGLQSVKNLVINVPTVTKRSLSPWTISSRCQKVDSIVSRIFSRYACPVTVRNGTSGIPKYILNISPPPLNSGPACCIISEWPFGCPPHSDGHIYFELHRQGISRGKERCLLQTDCAGISHRRRSDLRDPRQIIKRAAHGPSERGPGTELKYRICHYPPGSQIKTPGQIPGVLIFV